MNYAYVTVLSTNNYYKGVVALFESIERTNPKYHNYVVVINETIDEDIINKLKARGYNVILRPKLDFSSNYQNKSYNYWLNTFDKLNIFELTEYSKIVYIDSDIYINRNIDELFDMPHMSAVIAGKGRVPEWVEIGSGVMVIVPEKNMLDRFKEVIKNTTFTKDVGDQDLIEKAFNWKDKNLAISENYNLFANNVDYYVNNLNYDVKEIAAIHFIGSRKPWMYTEEEHQNYINTLIREERIHELNFYNKYKALLDSIE